MQPTKPEDVGLSSSRLARIGPVMQGYVDEGKLAGLLALVARRGRVAHLQCFGLADLEAHTPMHPDTIFRIYSMSKPITSVAALMLYEEGRFQLHDPVSRFIPGFKEMQVFAGGTAEAPQLVPMEQEVTIRHLLTHTSGLVYPNPEGSPVERIMARSGQERQEASGQPTLAEFVSRLVKMPLVHQPGSAWHYGFSTDVLGRVVEVISGRAFDAFLQERIFGPLGMVDTAFWVPPEKLERFSAMYGPEDDGRLKLLDPPAGEYAKPRRFHSGGGGLVSTAGDYLRFAQMLLNKGELDGVRLLGRKTVELMTMNHLPAALLPFGFGPEEKLRGQGFGLGVRVCMSVAETGIIGSVGDYGWGGLAGTDCWTDPQEELIGIVMPQFVSSPTVWYPYQEQFRVLAYQAIVD